MTFKNYYQNFLHKNLYPRKLKSLEPLQGFLFVDRETRKKFINFSSNDYLGLSQHPAVIQRSQHYANQYGTGTTSSRLVTGNYAVYEEIESALAKALGKPAALILGTGFQTNISILDALLDNAVLEQRPLVFCDKWCHASMLMNTIPHAKLQRFAHNNLDHLQTLLDKYIDDESPKFILAESIYSMEGDEADLSALVAIAKKYNAFLYIDDAHGVGVCGQYGFGKAREYSSDIPLIMGTFSKAFGSFGGYVACDLTLRDYFIQKSKGFIYSTGLPPMVLGAIHAALELIPTLDHERKRLQQLSQHVRGFFEENHLDYGNSTTHIIPWMIGDAKKTVLASKLLENEGILARAIQPPTVPVGKSRIRFCLSSAHTDADVTQLKAALIRVSQACL